jgi:diguanylate cyclase (GGDEF)-like protein/PAS domain S-box-containing protein
MLEKIFDNKTSLILVVDDSRFMRATFRNFLEAEGYEVVEAENGMDALSLFEKVKPSVILMDYVMPGINGAITCAKLENLPTGKQTPVIMITSLEDETSVNLAFESGATDYISKPINWAVLRQRLNRLIKARDTEKTLHKSEAFALSIINHAADGIFSTDVNGKIIYINPSAEKTFGYSYDYLIGKSINIIFRKLLYTEFDDFNDDDVASTKNKEILAFRNDGSTLPIELTISKFYIESHPYFTIITRDITERKRYEETIKYQAFYDSLTSLPNRLLLKERLASEILHCNQTNEKLAVLFLDLDRFKLINDTLGHDVGDKLLKIIAMKLKACLSKKDTISRIGGDEFVILLPGLVQEENLGYIASKILQAIKEPISIDGHDIYITISIGVTIYPNDGEDEETLLTNADIAMYRAKQEGKNNFQLYTPSLNAKALERLELENNLRHALEYNEFVVYYQPKVDTLTEKIIGMEALIRWQHPLWGLIPPVKFIPIAEETGLILTIGEWVLRTACFHNKALQNAGFPALTVAVNLSSLQFELQDLTKIVSDILAETGLSPEYLELEITESIAMQNIEHTLKIIKQLSIMGVKFSIDDFGTGYSSLSQLTNFDVNKLKIDKSFVEKVDGNTDNTVIASTVLALGKSLHLGIVAEGVETQAQVDFFKQNNCDEMQGYFFGRPMPSDDFERFYSEKLKAL